MSGRAVVDVAVQSLFAAVVIGAHDLLDHLAVVDRPGSGASTVATVAAAALHKHLGELSSSVNYGASVVQAYAQWLPILQTVEGAMAACCELRRVVYQQQTGSESRRGQKTLGRTTDDAACDWRRLPAHLFPYHDHEDGATRTCLHNALVVASHVPL